MSRSWSLESLQFKVGGEWRSVRFPAALTVLRGETRSGKSTFVECVPYALGLASQLTSAVAACDEIRLVVRIEGVRWQITRSAGNPRAAISHLDLSTNRGTEVLYPVTAEEGRASAADAVQDLLGIPRLGAGKTAVTLEHLAPWFYLRQADIGDRYLGGLTAAQRTVVGRTLLGVHDDALEALRREEARAAAAVRAAKAEIGKIIAARQARGLPDFEDLEQRGAQWKAEHERVTQLAQEGYAVLSGLHVELARMQEKGERAKAAQQAARRSADECEASARTLHGVAAECAGRLEALRKAAPEPGHCAHCRQSTAGRTLEPGHCVMCTQAWQGGADREKRARQAIVTCEEQLARARAAAERADAAAAVARARAAGADQEVLEAVAAMAAFQAERINPQQKRVAEAEAQARELAARLEGLAAHLLEGGRLRELLEQLPDLEAQRDAAAAALHTAMEGIEAKVKELVERLSDFFLHRMRHCDPTVHSAAISAKDFSATVNGRPFHVRAVAGAHRAVVNVNVALAWRDLAREVPSALLPPLLILDAPLAGIGPDPDDRRMAENLIASLHEAAAAGAHDGSVHQIIVTSTESLPGAAAREITVTKQNRAIPGVTDET